MPLLRTAFPILVLEKLKMELRTGQLVFTCSPVFLKTAVLKLLVRVSYLGLTMKPLILKSSLLIFPLEPEGVYLCFPCLLFSILRWLAEEIINIIDHDLYHLFRQAISAFEAKDYYNAGKYTGEIVGTLLNVTK